MRRYLPAGEYWRLFVDGIGFLSVLILGSVFTDANRIGRFEPVNMKRLGTPIDDLDSFRSQQCYRLNCAPVLEVTQKVANSARNSRNEA